MDVDYILYGEPSWEDVVEAFKESDWHEEQYLILAIEQHLQTEEEKKLFLENDLDITKILNGRWERKNENEKVVKEILSNWNQKLGFIAFGKGYGWF